MKIIEVLEFIQNNPNSTSIDVRKHFNVNKSDASLRLYKLHNSGLIKKIRLPNTKFTTHPYHYQITEFGIRYLKYKQENPGKRLQWHGLIPKTARKK